MTAVAASPDRADESAGHRPSPGIRRWMVVLVAIVVGVVVLLAAVVVLVWHLSAAAARSGVVVLTDQDSLTCSPKSAVTTTTVAAGNGSEETLRVPAVRINGPTSCRLRFVIVNQGSQSVQIDAVHLAGLYPLSGFRVANSSAGPLHGGVYPLDPGDAIAPSIAFSWHAGCIANGNTDFDTDTPTVRVTADGLPGTIRLPGTAYAVLGTEHSQTRCPWRH